MFSDPAWQKLQQEQQAEASVSSPRGPSTTGASTPSTTAGGQIANNNGVMSCFHSCMGASRILFRFPDCCPDVELSLCTSSFVWLPACHHACCWFQICICTTYASLRYNIFRGTLYLGLAYCT